MDKVNHVTDVVNEVHKLMDASLTAYKNYLANGKTYKYAKQLRKVNTATIELLADKKNTLSAELFSAANLLLEHLHIWRNKWDELENNNKPKLQDEFVFQNNHTFPKKAAALFEEEYQKLKGLVH